MVVNDGAFLSWRSVFFASIPSTMSVCVTGVPLVTIGSFQHGSEKKVTMTGFH
jgi:hypothetical protein